MLKSDQKTKMISALTETNDLILAQNREKPLKNKKKQCCDGCWDQQKKTKVVSADLLLAQNREKDLTILEERDKNAAEIREKDDRIADLEGACL